jgi:hypothetical protein
LPPAYRFGQEGPINFPQGYSIALYASAISRTQRSASVAMPFSDQTICSLLTPLS